MFCVRGYSPVYLVTDGGLASLHGADLRGANIEGVDFYLVDLRAAKYDPEQLEHFRQCKAILADGE